LKLCCGSLAVGLAALLAGCQFPAPPNKDLPPDATRVCEPASHVCTDGVATHCSDDGTSSTTETCTFGCAVSGDRCADLDPSNGLAAQLDEARTADPLVLTGDAVIDTTAGTITNGDGTNVLARSTTITGGPVEILAISVGSLQVQNVTVRGARALAILSHGDVTITGHFSASARNDVAGAGAMSGTAACAGTVGSHDGANSASGGGGGGFGTAGARGGRGGSLDYGLGGAADGNPEIEPLRGGCPGAGSTAFAAGGSGGGAIQLSTRGAVRLADGAFLSANGGGASGGPSDPLLCSTVPDGPCFAGSGGGSGGGLLIESAALVLEGRSGLVANGGSGHMGTSPASAASDGLLSEQPSPAFVPCAGTPCPRGGSGGAREALPEAGQGVSTGEAAGGGGAVGRIRINLPRAAQPQVEAPVLSPAPSIANASVR